MENQLTQSGGTAPAVVSDALLCFQKFPKMARLSRECIISEKIDGTNACILITEDGQILTGSRTRWITPADDNFGFARWCAEHREELMTLGVGRHFGEWWGVGIQRGYGGHPKTFSLFDTVRWCKFGEQPQRIPTGDPRQEKWQDMLPECCSLVPVLYRGPFETDVCESTLTRLQESGSHAAPGYMNPEGIVVFHTAAGIAFKKTIHGDEKGKSE